MSGGAVCLCVSVCVCQCVCVCVCTREPSRPSVLMCSTFYFYLSLSLGERTSGVVGNGRKDK